MTKLAHSHSVLHIEGFKIKSVTSAHPCPVYSKIFGAVDLAFDKPGFLHLCPGWQNLKHDQGHNSSDVNLKSLSQLEIIHSYILSTNYHIRPSQMKSWYTKSTGSPNLPVQWPYKTSSLSGSEWPQIYPLHLTGTMQKHLFISWSEPQILSTSHSAHWPPSLVYSCQPSDLRFVSQAWLWEASETWLSTHI